MNMIVNTPTWVWFILGYILFVGIKMLKTQEVNIYKLFIIPIVLIASRYQVFVSDNVTFYVLGLIVGGGIGWGLTGRRPVEIFPKSTSVKMQGSYLTLVLLLAFFLLKYSYGFLASNQHPIALEYGYTEVFVSAMLSGFFLGRASLYLCQLKCCSK